MCSVKAGGTDERREFPCDWVVNEGFEAGPRGVVNETLTVRKHLKGPPYNI